MPQWPLDIAELNMLSYRFYEQFARNLLSWKHSGFSIDDSVKCFNTSSQANLAEYISRPPISLEKLRYDPVHGRILWHTKYNRYFGQNVKMMDGPEFIRELVQHIPFHGFSGFRLSTTRMESALLIS